MTTTIIITFCSLLLVAYIFNLTAAKTKIPSVILLLLLGWLIKEGTRFLDFQLPDFTNILPILAMIGLILMVLEGSLELNLNRSKIGLISKSFLGALLSMLTLAFLLALTFMYFGDYSLKDSLINAIPFSIISSAIAIPSIRNLESGAKEFVTYESSLSDILGILFFNFIVINQVITIGSFGYFSLQLLIIAVVSLAATILLSVLLSKIDHHVKFFPIILLIILIYTVLEIYHLPALIFILLFGLAIGNLNELEHFKWIKRFRTEALKIEIQKFKELTIEAAFLIRALFFILFGYLLETAEILNTRMLIWSLGIVVAIFGLRAIQLKLSALPLKPLLFIAPRGLITILLFISITPDHYVPLVNKSLIVQVIVLSTLVMAVGLIATGKKEDTQVSKID